MRRDETRDLIIEGGGMRAGFAAGVLMALMDMGITGFDRALAVSASVPTLAYFAASQRREIEEVWRNELSTSKLVCYRNLPIASIAMSKQRPVINLDYLVYDVFKSLFPLDMEALSKGKTACIFALTEVPSGRQVFFGPGKHGIYETFKACMTVPGCCPFEVRLGGHDYVDGGTVNPLPAKAFIGKQTGKTLVILTKPLDCENEPPNFLERKIFWRYFNRHEWMLEKLWEAGNLYNEEVSFIEDLAEGDDPSAFIVCPDKMPPAKFLTKNRKKINRSIDMGYKKALRLEKEIKEFMARPLLSNKPEK